MKFDLSSKIALIWRRICASRLTIAYFVLSCLYCILTTVIAVQGFAVNEHSGNLMKAVMARTNISRSNYAHLEPHTGILHLCQTNEESMNPTDCPVIWPIPGAQPTIVNGTKLTKRSVEITQNFTEDGELNGLTIMGLDDIFTSNTDNRTINATLVCIQAMKWPVQHLLNQKREDVAFVAFQIWVLGMSCVAIFNESIPHIYATFITHLIAALWSAFQLWSTRNFKAEYSKLIMGVNDPDGYLGLLGGLGACDGQDLLPAYFKPRMDAEIATAVLNFISVFGSAYLAYRLIYVFGWSTFKHIGASVVINRIYKLALTLTILIQLALFYIVGSVALWIDQLFSGLFGQQAVRLELYKIWQIVVLVLLIPWLTLGWFSVRREWRHGMLVFNGLSVFFLGSWLAVIFSDSWRITFLQWRFFSILQVGAFMSCLLTLVLGILCRIFCFGRGLSQYLNPPSSDDLEFTYDFKPTPDVQWDAEKVAFPSANEEIPQLKKPLPQLAPKPSSAVLPSAANSTLVAQPAKALPVPAVAPPSYRSPVRPLFTQKNPFQSPVDPIDPHLRRFASNPQLNHGSDRSSSTSSTLTGHSNRGHQHNHSTTSATEYAADLQRNTSYGTMQTSYTASAQRGNGTIASFMTGVHTPGIMMQQRENERRVDELRNVSVQASNGHGKPRDWTID